MATTSWNSKTTETSGQSSTFSKQLDHFVA